MADRDWFFSGCPDKDGVPQRRSRMSDARALLAWDRLVLFVQFTDERQGLSPGVPSPGVLSGVTEYLHVSNVMPFLEHYAYEERVTENFVGLLADSLCTSRASAHVYAHLLAQDSMNSFQDTFCNSMNFFFPKLISEGPYSSGWIETLQRMLSAMRPFVPPDSLPDWNRQLKQAVAHAKAEMQRRASMYRRKEDLFEPNDAVPEGGRMVRKPEATMDTVLRNLARHEAACSKQFMVFCFLLLFGAGVRRRSLIWQRPRQLGLRLRNGSCTWQSSGGPTLHPCFSCGTGAAASPCGSSA